MDPHGHPSPRQSHVTRLINEAAAGNTPAGDELLQILYGELAALAQRAMRGAHGTMQPTALVHDVYRKLVESDVTWESRAHFLAVAAKAMRQILADHARARGAQRRGGDRARVTLVDEATPAGGSDVDLLVLDEALTELAELDPRKAELVQMRFFVGMKTAEIASYLGVSVPTVDRDWRMTKAWLAQRLATD